MKNTKLTAAAVAALLCAGMLTACGADTTGEPAQTSAKPAETTTVSEQTTTNVTTTTTTEKKADKTTEKKAETTTTAKKTDAAAETTTSTTKTETQTEAPQTESQTEAQQTEAQQTSAPAIWDALKLGGGVDTYIAVNGGFTKEEADSCLGSGKDIVYTYADRKLLTYVEGGSEKLTEIDITAAGIATRKGVSVGSALADVEAAYGAPNGPRYVYDTEDGRLEFMNDGSKVTMIALYE